MESRSNSSRESGHLCLDERVGLHLPRAIIDDVIADMLDVRLFSSSKPFAGADLSYSIGPNRFQVVKHTMEAVELKLLNAKLGSLMPEFLFYFGLYFTNDCNLLFKSFPANKRFFAAGMPGSVYGRLLPKASLYFVHSSYALNFLSRVPKELADETGFALSKGRIQHTHSQTEAKKAYSDQYAEDMKSFLEARDQEIMPGGLMALLIQSLPDESCAYQSRLITLSELLESSLKEMIEMGLCSEVQVDSFNVPIYHPSKEELERLIEENGSFSIEKMELLERSTNHLIEVERYITLELRRFWEELIKRHFGSQIIAPLFNQYDRRVAESCIPSDLDGKAIGELFILLKRKD